jgi:hypothetical protein
MATPAGCQGPPRSFKIKSVGQAGKNLQAKMLTGTKKLVVDVAAGTADDEFEVECLGHMRNKGFAAGSGFLERESTGKKVGFKTKVGTESKQKWEFGKLGEYVLIWVKRKQNGTSDDKVLTAKSDGSVEFDALNIAQITNQLWEFEIS